MNILSDIFCIFILTTISGSILLCICRIFRTIIDRQGSVGFGYYFMRATSLLYLIPVVPTIIFVYVYMKNDGAYVLHFGNRTLNIFICILLAVWLAGFSLSMRRFIRDYMVIKDLIRNSYPGDLRLEAAFKAARSRLGMQDKSIPIVMLDEIRTPAVTGMFKAVVVVPMDIDMSDSDLQLALAHETVHIKFHDNFVKFLTMIAVAINWYNPLAKKLVKELDDWNEYHCDVYTCRKLGVKMEYVKMLARIVMGKDAFLDDEPACITGAARENQRF